MASVSSLDKDLRAMRLDKYTPARANEARKWIESVLGHSIGSDLLDALKDGIILCRLANIALGPNTVRYKESAMPFVQMENISHFLRVCQAPPLNLPAHDIFLTVDLYESKDPAQVLQCIEAFSRKASALQPERIPTAVGGKKVAGISPEHTGSNGTASFSPPHARGTSVSSIGGGTTGSGRSSPTKGATSGAPAWNYAQYGWMGGASQGNQGITFGSRRQITTPAPEVPSLADRERKRKEAEAEAERQKLEQRTAEEKQRVELEAQEAQRIAKEEAQRAEKEAKRLEQERLQIEAEKKRWEEEERKWREEEDQRIKEEKSSKKRRELERQRREREAQRRRQDMEDDDRSMRSNMYREMASDTLQFEYDRISEGKARISELEKQLAEAKAREQEYENERKRIAQQMSQQSPAARTQTTAPSKAPDSDEQAWDDAERDYLRKQWNENQSTTSPRPLPSPKAAAALPGRPLPVPTARQEESTPTRPLPNPSSYQTAPQTPNRTDKYLASNPAPATASPATHTPPEAAFNSTAESDAEAQRRIASQKATKAGGWASKSLLEREMERERMRQQEWEEAQKQTQEAASKGMVDPNAGSAPGQSWDVHTYGYTGGDNMNRGTSGVYSGRRQILGPRPLEKK